MVANPAQSNRVRAICPGPIGLSGNLAQSQLGRTQSPALQSPALQCSSGNPGSGNAGPSNGESGNAGPSNSSNVIHREAIMAHTINTMPYEVQQNCEGRQWWATVSQSDLLLVSKYRRQLNRSNRQRANQALRNAVANGDLDNLDIPNLDRRNARWWAS